MEYLNHDTNWLMTITMEIDKSLIDREYINLFMQMYMQWRKDDGSTSSFQQLIITREKIALSQFKLYIENQTTIQCLVCCSCQKTTFIQSAKYKERIIVFYIC